MDNYEKNLKYRSLHESLSKALKNEFYYEAIFIEYAILEDRTSSILKHAKINIEDSTLNNKIKAIKGEAIFKDNYIKKHIDNSLLDSITKWKNERNLLIHDLVKLSYSNDDIKKIALKGQEIVKKFSGKSTLVTKYLDKKLENKIK